MNSINEQIRLHNDAIGLLVNISTARDADTRELAKQAYAEHMQNMTQQHIEAAISDAEDWKIKDEIFGAASYADASPRPILTIYDQLPQPAAHVI